MSKKLRNIYEVEIGAIASWDEEAEFPEDINSFISLDEVELPFYTASISEAYKFYKELHESDYDDNIFTSVTAWEVEVTDEKWMELLQKGTLDYDDFSKYRSENALNTIAWDFDYEGQSDRDDSLLEELLIVQSENFNMRVICEKAGVSYSTYRGFKNNKQPFSRQKILELLKTMNAVGNDCWNEDIELTYKVWNRRK